MVLLLLLLLVVSGKPIVRVKVPGKVGVIKPPQPRAHYSVDSTHAISRLLILLSVVLDRYAPGHLHRLWGTFLTVVTTRKGKYN